jgi:hypothetical protein
MPMADGWRSGKNNQLIRNLDDVCTFAHHRLCGAHSPKGNPAKARVAYKDFPGHWQDAEPGIPIPLPAKAKYVRLK